MTDLQLQVDFLTNLVKDNQLHEPYCVAFSLPKHHSGSFGFAASMADPYCHCWLDKDNKAPEGQAFGVYNKATEELGPVAYVNRYYARLGILQDTKLSPEKNTEGYWGSQYLIVEVSVQPKNPAES